MTRILLKNEKQIRGIVCYLIVIEMDYFRESRFLAKQIVFVQAFIVFHIQFKTLVAIINHFVVQ